MSAGIFVHNSKDAVDAVTGALFHASQYATEYAYDYGEDIDTVIEASAVPSAEVERQQLSVDFEEALKRLQGPIQPTKKQQVGSESQYLDFGFGRSVPLYNQYTDQGILVI